MTKLSDTQLVVLSAAAGRDDHKVLPLPGSLRGGAATKVVGALISRGLIAERVTDQRTKADAALNRIWRNDPDGRAILLHITDAGLAAIGVESDDADIVLGGATQSSDTDVASKAASETDPAPKPRTCAGTKQAQLIEMLGGRHGASIDEIVAATGWRPNTVRGAIAGALKKKLGLTVNSEKRPVRGRVYWIER